MLDNRLVVNEYNEMKVPQMFTNEWTIRKSKLMTTEKFKEYAVRIV